MRDVQQAQPDDREPTPGRRAELRAAYEANVAARQAPDASDRIGTRTELLWVIPERRWSVAASLPEGYERANVSGADLFGVNLVAARFGKGQLAQEEPRR